MGLPTLSCQKWIIVFVFSFVYGILGLIYTLQAPFYPAEAQNKGASATQYGSVAGIYALTICLASPVMGYLISCVGSKNMYYAGILGMGTSTVLFGCLPELKSLTMFLTASIGLRIVEGLGFSATYVAMFSFVPTLFPDQVSFVTGVLEMSNVVAFGIGPALGGLFYSIGGFALPFIVTGSTMLLSILLVVPAIWNFRFDDAKPAPGLHTLTLFGLFDVSINFFVIFIDAVTTSYLFTNLAQYLQLQFKLLPLYCGIVFCAFGVFTGFLSPIWGYYMNKAPKSPFYLIVMGVVLKVFGGMLIGPVAVFKLHADLITTLAGVSVYAIGNGLVLIAAYVNAPNQARNNGFPNDGTTSALVFGAGVACYSLGSGVGAPISGLLYDHLGFRLAELFIPWTELLTLLVLILYDLQRRWSTKSAFHRLNSEKSALLEDEQKSSQGTQVPVIESTSRSRKIDFGSMADLENNTPT